LRDDLHLVALEHARSVAARYDRAEEFPIPDQVDDRLRDIFEPLFAIAAVADAEKRITLHVDAMMKAAKALSGIRSEDNAHEAALVAALRLFGFRSAIHRRERFWTGEELDPAKETARGYGIDLGTLRDLLSRYST